MKILTLLISLFNIFFNTNENITINEEEQYYEYTVTKPDKTTRKYGNFSVEEKREYCTIFLNDVEIDSYNSLHDDFYFILDEKLVLFLWNRYNGRVEVREYNFSGEKILLTEIDNKFTNGFYVYLYNDVFFICGGVKDYTSKVLQSIYENKISYLKNKDTVVARLDSNYNISSASLEGGELNEYFYSMTISNDKIYLLGYKDTLTGYSFGNGGVNGKGYIFAKYNIYLNLLDYKIFEEELCQVEVVEEKVMLLSKTSFYLFDTSLNQQFGLKFPQRCLFIKPTEENQVLIICEDEFNLLSLDTGGILQKEKLSLLQSEIIYNDGAFFFMDYEEIYKVIMYNKKSFESDAIYDFSPYVNIQLEGVGKTYFLKERTIENFDPLVCGKYHAKYDYEDFVLEGEIEVLKRCNVSSEYIYPVGYFLAFSGKGYLNGKEILNNTCIFEEGKYTLALFDNENNEERIEFLVRNEQINFSSNDLYCWDEEVKANEEAKVLISLSTIPQDVIVNKVIVNEEEYPFDYLNNILMLKFKEENPGMYNYDIQKIYYTYLDNEYSLDVNYKLTLKVLYSTYNIESRIYNDRSYFYYDAIVFDEYDTSRLLKVKIVDNEEHVYLFPLGDIDIVIESLPFKEDVMYEVYFYMVVDNGSKKSTEYAMLSMDMYISSSVLNLGRLDITKEADSLKSFIINIKNTRNVVNIYNNEELIYTNSKTDYVSVVAYTCGICIVTVLFIYFILKRKRKVFIF